MIHLSQLLKTIWKLPLVQNAIAHLPVNDSHFSSVIPILVPVCFQGQLKSWYCLRWLRCHLGDHLVPIQPLLPVFNPGSDALGPSSHVRGVELRNGLFFSMLPSHFKILYIPEIQIPHSLLEFRRKTKYLSHLQYYMVLFYWWFNMIVL